MDPGYDFFHPTRVVVYHMWEPRRPIFKEQFHGESRLHEQRRQVRQAEYRCLQTSASAKAVSRPPTDWRRSEPWPTYEKFVGIDMQRRVLTSFTGLLGVVEDSKSDEVLCKFGSLTEPFSRRFLQS